MPEKKEKVRHPCVYFGKEGVECSSPEMVMRCEKYYNEGPDIYDTIPSDCAECLLANILAQIGVRRAPVAYMKEKDD